jgi:anti-anti-sigma factor
MSEKVATSPLTLAIDRMDDAAVVRCSGRLVSDVSDSFYLEIKQLIPEFKGIVLDLTDLTHMDSMGLGALVRLYVSAKSTGCSLKLMNLGKPVRQLLGVTHLLSVFQIIGENNIKII